MIANGLPRAVVYCDGAFATTNGKTAHGLIRRSGRFQVDYLVDSTLAGRDAGELLDGAVTGQPVVADVDEAVRRARDAAAPLTHFVVGLAPDGGRLDGAHRGAVARGLELGLHVTSGLHDFLSEDPELAAIARRRGVEIHDIRRPPPVDRLHFFTGKIEEVTSPRIAMLGTDSAVGKRTTAWMLVDALAGAGVATELIGTGQTAWLQGARYCLILDALVNDFVTGEIEHTVHQAWSEAAPDVLVVEGQGSLLNPAYPGGFEILAAARPAAVVLQHAPARLAYDGFPGYSLHPLERQIEAVEVISGCRVAAITINAAGLDPAEAPQVCQTLARRHRLPVVDPLREGVSPVVEALRPFLRKREAA
jgi:uncharacterized NAD-dependent epimerase/dehydratase family protein